LLAVFLVLTAVFGYYSIPSGESQGQTYQSGEAMNFNGQVVIATTDTGRLELFRSAGDKLHLARSLESDTPNEPEFVDTVLTRQGERLYAFATNHKYIYKYDITGLPAVDLVAKNKDNSGDRFHALGSYKDRLYSVGSRGVKVWRYDLTVVNSYDLHSTVADNIKFTANGNYLFHLLNNNFQIIDAMYREPVMQTGIKIRQDHGRHFYYDDRQGAVYVVDDYFLKKIGFNGLLEKFRHISHIGYDADGSAGQDHIYFSDGIGIVKSRKSDLQPLDWRYTTELGGGQGWAMGLRAVEYEGQERVVVFNGSSILLFTGELELMDSYQAKDRPGPKVDPPYLRLDKHRAAPGSRVSLRGGNFGAGERIRISLAGETYHAITDNTGDFTKIMTIPAVKSGIRDIRATGRVSGLTYSTSFTVE